MRPLATDRELIPPLLGVSKDATLDELQLASEIDALHQLIYMQGGLNSTNAAIEEVAKLLFLRYSTIVESSIYRDNDIDTDGVFENPHAEPSLVATLKHLFKIAQERSGFRVLRPDGTSESLWPSDEPFRLASHQVAAQAMEIIENVLASKTSLLDPLGTAFDAFLSGRYDHSGGLGTYLTPSSVARFMAETALSFVDVESLKAQPNLLIDPFCGTGRFLVAGYQAILESGVLGASAEVDLLSTIVGADQSSSAVAKSALNLILYGARTPRVFVVEDSISSGDLGSLAGTFPLVLTNPPFGGGKYDTPEGIRAVRKYFPGLSASKIDPALGGIARGLQLLSDNGVMGIVLPDGIINGKHFLNAMRQNVFQVVASVSLPTATFALSGTVAKTSAVFIRKASTRQFAVLARAEHVGFLRKSGKAVADPDGNDMKRLAPLISKLAANANPNPELEIQSSSPLVALVPRDALTSIDPSRFDADALQGRHAVLESGGVSLGSYCHPAKRQTAGRGTGSYPFVSVLHVDSYGSIDWVEVEGYKPVTSGQFAHANDVVVSLLNPSKLRAAVIPEDVETVECSLEFGVFTGMEYPYAILAMLHDPRVAVQLRPLGSGTSSSRRRITAQDVLDLAVPQMSEAALSKLNAHVKSQICQIEGARVSLASNFILSDE